MFSKSILLVTFSIVAVAIAGCGGKKDISVKPTVTWIIDGPIVTKDDVLRKEIAEWFSPYKLENICSGLRIYPQINVVRLDRPGETIKLLNIDPKTLSAGNQNFVQKIFGAKPKFEKLEELAKNEIASLKLHDSLKNDVIEKQNTIDFSNINTTKYSAVLIKFSGKKSEKSDFVENNIPILNKKNIIAVENDPLKFKTTVASVLCGDDAKKSHGDLNFTLIDVDRLGFGVATLSNSSPPASGDTVVNVKPGEKKVIPAKPGGNVTVNVGDIGSKSQSDKGVTSPRQQKTNSGNDEDDFMPGQKHTKPIANPQSH